MDLRVVGGDARVFLTPSITPPLAAPRNVIVIRFSDPSNTGVGYVATSIPILLSFYLSMPLRVALLYNLLVCIRTEFVRDDVS
jgi:hypothetical protein